MTTINAIYFSPTGTTYRSIEAIIAGFDDAEVKKIDLTFSSEIVSPKLKKDDLVIIAMPVYSGRLPKIAVDRLQSITGNDTPVVIVVTYGNRHYDDALVELSDLCCKQGFKPVAAIAMIGEHSFASEKFPIATNRPDEKDFNIGKEFGKKIANLLIKNSDSFLDLETLPGNRPYKADRKPGATATYSDYDSCVLCGKCLKACPANIITIENKRVVTAPADCIWCLACVKSCPTNARKIGLPIIAEYAEKLNKNCRVRKKPELFI